MVLCVARRAERSGAMMANGTDVDISFNPRERRVSVSSGTMSSVLL